MLSGPLISRTHRWTDPLICEVSAGQGLGREPGNSLAKEDGRGRGRLQAEVPT